MGVVCRWREDCTEFQDRGILRWRLSHLRAHLTSLYVPATSDAFGLVRWPWGHLLAHLTLCLWTRHAPCALAIVPSSGAQVRAVCVCVSVCVCGKLRLCESNLSTVVT